MLKREKRNVQDKDILRKKYIDLQQSIKTWANKSINVEVININYSELVLEPMLVAFRIQEFLDRSLDLQSMAAVIDEKLYRERLTKM